MKIILAVSLGKGNSVFCKLNTSSLKPEYLTVKMDPDRSCDIFADLDGENYIAFSWNYYKIIIKYDLQLRFDILLGIQVFIVGFYMVYTELS